MKQILRGSFLATAAVLLATAYTHSACAMGRLYDEPTEKDKILARQVEELQEKTQQLAIVQKLEKEERAKKEVKAFIEKFPSELLVDFEQTIIQSLQPQTDIFFPSLPEFDVLSSPSKLEDILLTKIKEQPGYEKEFEFKKLYNALVKVLDDRRSSETKEQLKTLNKIKVDWKSIKEALLSTIKKTITEEKKLMLFTPASKKDIPPLKLISIGQQYTSALDYTFQINKALLTIEAFKSFGKTTDMMEILKKLQENRINEVLTNTNFLGYLNKNNKSNFDSDTFNQNINNLLELSKKNLNSEQPEKKEIYAKTAKACESVLNILKAFYNSEEFQYSRKDISIDAKREKLESLLKAHFPEDLYPKGVQIQSLIKQYFDTTLNLTDDSKKEKVIKSVQKFSDLFFSFVDEALSYLENPF